MTQREQQQTAEFKAKWMLVFSDITNDAYPIKIYQNRQHPNTFCRPSCGNWDVWEMNPVSGWRQDSVFCTYEYIMENY